MKNGSRDTRSKLVIGCGLFQTIFLWEQRHGPVIKRHNSGFLFFKIWTIYSPVGRAMGTLPHKVFFCLYSAMIIVSSIRLLVMEPG
jgi:hypothetical protein